MGVWKKNRSKICIGLSVIGVAVAVFDLITDWWMFSDFCRYGGGKMIAPLGFFCVIASVLFVMEIRNCVFSFRLHLYKERHMHDMQRRCNVPTTEMEIIDPNDMADGPAMKKNEQKLMKWEEIVTLLLLFLEDFPVTVIIYRTFHYSICSLFTQLFEDSFTVRMTLLGAVVSAVWKGMQSFRYCCSCKYHGVKGVWTHIGCCCLRFLRPIVAICLIGFAGYIYDMLNRHGVSYRAECYMYSTTASTVDANVTHVAINIGNNTLTL